MMTEEEAQKVAEAVKTGGVIPLKGDTVFDSEFTGKVYSKGRPRASARGHFYTPENTRKFEKAVREWLADFGLKPVLHPCAVWLVLYDRTPKGMKPWMRVMAAHMLTFSTIGDIENRAKAILDAGNGIIYADDKQVSYETISREYAEEDGFRLTVYRSGFSAAELEKIREFM